MEFINELLPVDKEQVDEQLKAIHKTRYTETEKQLIMRRLVSLIDLTTLNGDDTEQKVTALCKKAIETKDSLKHIPQVAAVCVYPNFAELVSRNLKGKGINTAVVATGFPSGQTFREVKLLEVKKAVAAGADEIDMVISRGLFLDKKYQEVFDEIKQVKEACGAAHLKVILETGELENLTQVKTASHIAMEAGADFIKTSTGKIKPAATEEAFLVMTEAIRVFYKKTGKMTGIKPAGGISDTDTALRYYNIVAKILGDRWLDNKLFRIGASSLLGNLLRDIRK